MHNNQKEGVLGHSHCVGTANPTPLPWFMPIYPQPENVEPESLEFPPKGRGRDACVATGGVVPSFLVLSQLFVQWGGNEQQHGLRESTKQDGPKRSLAQCGANDETISEQARTPTPLRSGPAS